MKKNTFRNCSLFKYGFLLFIFAFISNKGISQVQNKGLIYVDDNGLKYIESGNFYFGNPPASTTTTRTQSTYGILAFNSTATWSGASNVHYVDGYVRIYGTSPFVFPIGQSGVYAPAKVIANAATGVDAAYYNSDPSAIGTNLDTDVANISSVEYWDIHSLTASGKISLSWRSSSNITTITNGVLNDLTILGYDGSKWVKIASKVDFTSIQGATSNFIGGSISSLSNVDLTSFTAFTLGAKIGECSPLVTSSGVTKTWNGSWSPSDPTLSDPVIINSAYSGNLSCNSLELNADITLVNGEFVEVVNDVTGTGKIIMSSEASVVQRNKTATAPNIELSKLTRSMVRFDYIYWGTPISGNFLSQINGAQALTATSAGAFDLKYKYTTGTGGGWVTLDAVTTGKGFITRIKSLAPFTNATNTDQISMKFTGTANNGDITVPITNNTSSLNGGTSYELLANPYPCAIDAEKFLTDNLSVDGAVYLWTAATLYPGGGAYNQADYAVWNLAGTVNSSPISQLIDGKIASGQSFRVKALGTGTATFTNCMRMTGENNNFFRTQSNTSEVVDRFKLNMTGDNSVFSQILIAYLPKATYDYDRLYDAGRNSVSTAQLYSILNNTKIAINGRPSFNVYDAVPLGVSKGTTNIENFTISIQEKEGVFSTNDVYVYLHDKLLETYTDLSTENYTFSSDTTLLNERFEIVYQNNTLHNTDYYANEIGIVLNDGRFSAKSLIGMESLEFYDITGRKLETINAENKNEISTPFYHAQGIYLVKIKLENGSIATKKMINEN